MTLKPILCMPRVFIRESAMRSATDGMDDQWCCLPTYRSMLLRRRWRMQEAHLALEELCKAVHAELQVAQTAATAQQAAHQALLDRIEHANASLAQLRHGIHDDAEIRNTSLQDLSPPLSGAPFLSNMLPIFTDRIACDGPPATKLCAKHVHTHNSGTSTQSSIHCHQTVMSRLALAGRPQPGSAAPPCSTHPKTIVSPNSTSDMQSPPRSPQPPPAAPQHSTTDSQHVPLLASFTAHLPISAAEAFAAAAPAGSDAPEPPEILRATRAVLSAAAAQRGVDADRICWWFQSGFPVAEGGAALSWSTGLASAGCPASFSTFFMLNSLECALIDGARAAADGSHTHCALLSH